MALRPLETSESIEHKIQQFIARKDRQFPELDLRSSERY